MPEVSIIIPVYNVEKYLHKCLDSVVNQTFVDFEVILINDGSSDRSGLICDEYVLKDNRIKVVHQINQGVSVARNIGIKLATGKYVYFIDSDDWILPNTIQEVYSKIIEHDVDLVVTHCRAFCDDDQVYSYYKILDKYYDACIKLDGKYNVVSIINDFRVAVWSKLYKKSIIDQYNLCFDKGLINEDNSWQWYYGTKIKAYYFLSYPFYQRLVRGGSIIINRKVNKHKVLDILYIARNAYYHLKKYNLYQKYQIEFDEWFVQTYNNVISEFIWIRRWQVIKLCQSLAKECSIPLSIFPSNGFIYKVFFRINQIFGKKGKQK